MADDDLERTAGSSPAGDQQDGAGATHDDTAVTQPNQSGEEPGATQQDDGTPPATQDPAAPTGRKPAEAPTPAEVAAASVEALLSKAAEPDGDGDGRSNGERRERKQAQDGDPTGDTPAANKRKEGGGEHRGDIRIADKHWKALPNEVRAAIIELRKRDSEAKPLVDAGRDVIDFLVEHQVTDDFRTTPREELALTLKALGAARRAAAGTPAQGDDQVIASFQERMGIKPKQEAPITASELRELANKVFTDGDEKSLDRLKALADELEKREKGQGATPPAATGKPAAGQGQPTTTRTAADQAPAADAAQAAEQRRARAVQESIYAGRTRSHLVSAGIKADPEAISAHLKANVIPEMVELLTQRLPPGIDPWMAVGALGPAEKHLLAVEAHESWAKRAAARRADRTTVRQPAVPGRRPMSQTATGGRRIAPPALPAGTSPKAQASASVDALCGNEGGED